MFRRHVRTRGGRGFPGLGVAVLLAVLAPSAAAQGGDPAAPEAVQDGDPGSPAAAEEGDPVTTFADWMSDSLPEWAQQGFAGVALWQWLALLVLVIGGVLVDRLAVRAVSGVVRRAAARTSIVLDAAILRGALRPIGLLAMAGTWWVLLTPLDLGERPDRVLRVAVKFVALVAGLWGALRVVDVLADFLGKKAGRTESKLDDLLIPLVRKSLKIFLLAFGLLFSADNLGVNVSTLLAGIGIGSLAFALAAQDTVRNLFGTLTVLLDRTFNVGDWVKVGEVEGTVEHVGFRSTRVRTFYNSLITVPNGNLITAHVDNLGRRRYRRWKSMVSVTYDTPPETIEAFCEGIRELVRRHPYTRKDYFEIWLNAFTPSSLDIMVYMFFETPDWSTELRERGRLMLDILRLAQRLGVEFAFPTQTLHLQPPAETEAAPPVEPPVGDTAVDAAHSRGRKEARAIVKSLLGEPARVPPPPRAQRAGEEESRGEG